MTRGVISRYLSTLIFLYLVLGKSIYAAQANNSIDGIRVWPAPENTRLVFDLKKTPDYSYFSLSNPQRLVIDFQATQNLVNLQALAKNDKRITTIRTSKAKNKTSTRLVLELRDKYNLNVFPLAPAGQYGNRLVIDLFDQDRVTQSVQTAKKNDKRDIVVAIVAGHGGEDPGSIGAKGTYEKHVTLNIAKKLAALIDKQKGLKSAMIRTGDYYVNHNRKTTLARKHKADLLISIHADAFTSSKPHGASVLVQSTRRANSEFTRWIANRQKESELLGGAGDTIKKTKDKNLAITLADMKKEYTMASSYEFAEHVISQLKKVTKLHKKKPEGLSLAVLKSSDIPSVLIETGFISNPREEKNLNSSAHQQKLANAIFNSVDNYFANNAPDGTYYASVSYKKHKVSRGESLSVVAHRYNVTVGKLKAVNNLNSNVVRIGQTLKIPRAD
ncbi:N-acetylmuramoyl-L-alanine amidase [Thalassotalea castellviae]|uniref:N-acetylmuramoyl-L-alanine amidase n=1 Tax=Thalassotalea castellviae TaxID=3075612 RepID=A0ABU3A0R2_9GAMM|nr:N-acetylmuramoyl-L-alanine amidase [Thalassotalea sp. W431]MDT0603761.1 N-acetylmuramoyl-L-alanine amidase [Thalassotalea sp. W431]